VTAYRAAGLLRYAALQFVVLTAIAMQLYAGGNWFDPAAPHYHLAGNFLSDLGMTHAFSGRSNYASSAVFAIALASLGIALVMFVWTWRGFAFARGRARRAGIASAWLGTASGLCFAGVAVTPFDLALWPHNILVIAAFALLFAYVITITVVMWRNGIGGGRLAANLAYLALVVGYFTLVLGGPPYFTPHGHTVQVVGQKVIAYGSMLHIFYIATTTRRAFVVRPES
jgi:hypothetical protein